MFCRVRIRSNRQKIDLTYEPDTIRQILNSLSKAGDLLMFSSSTSDGKIGSMAAFAKDSKRSSILENLLIAEGALEDEPSSNWLSRIYPSMAPNEENP